MADGDSIRIHRREEPRKFGHVVMVAIFCDDSKMGKYSTNHGRCFVKLEKTMAFIDPIQGIHAPRPS